MFKIFMNKLESVYNVLTQLLLDYYLVKATLFHFKKSVLKFYTERIKTVKLSPHKHKISH